MKVLLVSNMRPDERGIVNPIMIRMKDAIEKDERVESVDYIPFCNSFKSFSRIRNASKNYDVIHIHFGGLYALLIWFSLLGIKKKKFITFHGTDIHAKAIKTTKSIKQKIKIWMNQKASFLSILLFDKCGFVSKEMIDYVPCCFSKTISKKSFIQSLGVDYSVFKPISKDEAQEHLGITSSKKLVLFSDVANTTIKRRDLAMSIVKELGEGFELLIMCGVVPNEVPFYINACDCLLLTSDEEGSPNIIREALSLNKRVYSVNVGDVQMQLGGLHNSSIISRDPIAAAITIKQSIEKPYIDNTRQTRANVLDFSVLCHNVVNLY